MTWTDKGCVMSTIKKPGVGVVVCRVHTDLPHAGHQKLLKAANEHSNLVILVGCAQFPLTKGNPLDFPTRKQMLQTCFPDAIILPLHNQKSDAVWSKKLDQAVNSIFPFQQKILYGSRDSFFSKYSGNFKYEMVEEVPGMAATNKREELGRTPINDPVFRAGVIYASQNLYPRVQPTVDIGIYRKVKDSYQILLGQKENSTEWYFPGGFVDIKDNGLEEAAAREAHEETNILVVKCRDWIKNFKYVTSVHVNDWRSQPDCQVMTTFFALEYKNGMGVVRAGDDLKKVKWFSTKQAPSAISPTHSYLMSKLLTHLKVTK